MATTADGISAQQFSKLQPPRRYLFGPGPTQVHPRVYEALAKPIVSHVDPYFFAVMEDVQRLLKMAFGAEQGITLAVSGTGSGGMEAAVSNFVEPGMKCAVFANGFFCDRITEMAKRNGARLVIINREATDFDDTADLVVRQDIGTVLEPFIVH